MFRFFVNKKEGNYFILDKATLNHIKVARINEKPFICIYNSKFYITKLKNQNAWIETELNENHEFEHEVILALSVIKLKRFEWAIQKAAELGATKLIPVLSQNIQLDVKQLNSKIARWQTISQNASEQSFRNKVMEILEPQSFEQVLELKVENKYLAHEKSREPLIDNFVSPCLFLIGPEGGFSEQEVEKAEKHNFKIINLGNRILRSETSALFVLSRIKN